MFLKLKLDYQISICVGLLCWGMMAGCASTQYAEVRRSLGRDDFAQARSQLEAAGPTDAEGWALLAECRLRQQDYLGLAAASGASLALSSEFRPRLDRLVQQAFADQLNAGIVAFEEGNDPEALKQFNQLVVFSQALAGQRTPEMARAVTKITALTAAVSIRLRDYPNAKAYLEGLKSEWRTNPALLERLAFIYYQMGEPQLCVATCETLLVRDSANLTVLKLRAEACQQMGHADATVNAYRDALEQSGASVLHRNLGIILFQLEDWKQARSHLEASCANHPSDSLDLKVMVAECLYNEGRYEAALQTFKQVSELRLADPNLYRAMGACHRGLGEHALAEAAFREADRLLEQASRELPADSGSAALNPADAKGGRSR